MNVASRLYSSPIQQTERELAGRRRLQQSHLAHHPRPP